MLRLFAADGSVKKEFPAAVSVQYVGSKARLWGAKTVVEEITLQPGELVAENFPGKQ